MYSPKLQAEERVHLEAFTLTQCRMLATSGKRTHLGFDNCRFDEGAAFLEALDAREDEELGPANLTFRKKLPFDEGNLVASMDGLVLESLKLSLINLSSEDQYLKVEA
jgi:hypothetical protein